ncbi:hypothetical protein FS837_005038 [Tulasnella sp. UAMH 9824]|nr:hypothetical protein FS837_005038 [Tulasnella sp. UAMH 9824]
MKLTHWKVEGTVDPTTWMGGTHVYGRFRHWDGDYAEEIRTVLQAQPLLESLSFVGCSFSEETAENLRSYLVPSDLPRLKHLTGNPDIAAAFLCALPELEYLNIIERYWTEERVTSMEKSPFTNRASISKLSLQILNPDKKFWRQFARILALFSNVETLQLQVVITMYNWSPDEQFEPGEDYFSTIVQAISPLLALRHLEFAGEIPHPVKEGIADDVPEGLIAKCKIACRQLESFIDHRGRLWEYRFKSDGSGAGSFEQVGVVEKMEDRGPKNDFPYEKAED